jgi:cell division protein FtsI (penicillin-binding protein 3)
MKVKEKKWIRFRIYVVAFFFLCGLLIVLARAYQLQVLENDKLTSIARAGYRGKIKLPPKRGTIFDREGHELAVSIEVESIFAHPKLVKNKSEAAKSLSKILSLKQSEILKSLQSHQNFVWLERKTSPDKVMRVKALGLEGVDFTTETRRYYPLREIAAHVIGFAGSDNRGLEGLEKSYDRMLRGPQNILIQMQDALRRPFYISRPNTPGHEMHDVILTLDKDIQYKAQQSLRGAVQKTNAKSGQCVIVNPDTGEILAMAVVPEFNPNEFGRFHPGDWRNRTVTDVYEPGSTIKAFLLAAALDSHAVSPQTKFYCEQGAFSIAGHVIHDTHKYGDLTVTDIVKYSSNIGAIKVGQKIGFKRFTEYLKKFGFGAEAGIGLVGERGGFVRPDKNARLIDQATIYFGQGMTTTTLQLAMAMATIANGGKLMRPYIVKMIKDQKGHVVRKNRPQMVRRVLPEAVSNKVARILEEVVSDEGTAPLAAINGYRVAGKTGTSQKVDPRTKRYSKKNYMALFSGFVPADGAKLVIVVAIDEPKGQSYGGLVAGPVFKEVGQWTLNHLRINPELQLAKTEADPARAALRNLIFGTDGDGDSALSPHIDGLLPDFTGRKMREVLKTGRELGVKILLEGTGVAVGQDPGPGLPLNQVSAVKVRFSPPM